MRLRSPRHRNLSSRAEGSSLSARWEVSVSLPFHPSAKIQPRPGAAAVLGFGNIRSTRRNHNSCSWLPQGMLHARKSVFSQGRMDLCSALLSVTAPPWKQDPRPGSLEIPSVLHELLTYLFSSFPSQFSPGDGLFWDQHGLPQLLHQPCGSVLCQPEIQELLPGRNDPSRAPGCTHQAQGNKLILFFIPNFPF